MNDRQRLEAIVAVVCKYLPPDGINREDAMREIIGLVDPLPEPIKPFDWESFWKQQFDRASDQVTFLGEQVKFLLAQKTADKSNSWQGLTDEELSEIYNVTAEELSEIYDDFCTQHPEGDVNIADFILIARALEEKLKEKNT